MSTITMIPAVEPSFGTSACSAAWLVPAGTKALAGGADTYVLNQGSVDFGMKRRPAKGSPAWRATDC